MAWYISLWKCITSAIRGRGLWHATSLNKTWNVLWVLLCYREVSWYLLLECLSYFSIKPFPHMTSLQQMTLKTCPQFLLNILFKWKCNIENILWQMEKLLNMSTFSIYQVSHNEQFLFLPPFFQLNRIVLLIIGF